ncbi:MAG: gephyrin-like molybdotransferase Glp [Propioniciclava sp.]
MALFGRRKTTDLPEQDDPVIAEPPAPAPAVAHRSVEQQRDFLLAHVGAMRPFGMQIHDVVGLTLCEDITSDLDLPLVTTARISGFGVRSSDLVGATADAPARLYVVGRIGIADDPGSALMAGAAVEVEEGAILPDGVDAIVPPAHCTMGPEGNVHITTEMRLYANLRRAGSELADGERLLAAGETLTPRSVGVLAEVGIDRVLVRPRPRVVVVSVSDVLVPPGEALTRPQQRYDSATALLAASARATGATVYPMGILPRDAEVIGQTIADQQIRADLILVIGGGELIRQVADGMGDLDEAYVALNGEARYGFAALGSEGTPMLMLPSGSVNVYAAYHALIRPMINKLNEADPLSTSVVTGRLGATLDLPADVTHYLPAHLGEDGTVDLVSTPDSQLAWDLERADVLVILPAGVRTGAGSEVTCIVLEERTTSSGTSR